MKNLLEKTLLVCDHAEIYMRDVFSSSVQVFFNEIQDLESSKNKKLL